MHRSKTAGDFVPVRLCSIEVMAMTTPAIPDLQMLNRIISINPSYQFYLIKISITTKKVVIRRD